MGRKITVVNRDLDPSLSSLNLPRDITIIKLFLVAVISKSWLQLFAKPATEVSPSQSI
jgi:hypothetical protein